MRASIDAHMRPSLTRGKRLVWSQRCLCGRDWPCSDGVDHHELVLARIHEQHAEIPEEP